MNFKIFKSKEKSILSYKPFEFIKTELDLKEKDTNLWMEECKPNTSNWFMALKNRKLLNNEIFSMKRESAFSSMENGSVNRSSVGISTLDSNLANMKTCPGVVGLFNRTILLKAPMDMKIYVKDLPDNNPDFKKSTMVIEAVLPDLLPIAQHDQSQFLPPGHYYSMQRNLKFQFPFTISSTHPVVFMEPYWHNDIPFTVIPGGLFDQFHKITHLNLNVFYKMDSSIEVNRIEIKKGTVLAYMVFPYPVSLKHDPSIRSSILFQHLINNTVT